MNHRDLELAARFLDLASELFASRACGDFAFPSDWSQSDCDQFNLEMHKWNGDPENHQPGQRTSSDWFAMSFLAHKLREESLARSQLSRVSEAAPGPHQAIPVEISDYSMELRHGAEVYVCANGVDDGDVRISVVASGCSMNVDLSIDELERLQEMVAGAIEEAFEVQPELRCPACGYTFNDAKLHGDHRNCRRYPFFPGESGNSFAS